MGVGSTQDVTSPLGPISFIFMQFTAKSLPDNRLAPPLGWQPLGNPESATESSGIKKIPCLLRQHII